MDLSWGTLGLSTVIATGMAALAGWLGQVWATRIANRELAAHERELEKFKQKANASLEVVRVELQKRQLIHRVQFEKEFTVYETIWEHLVPLDESVRRLRPTFELADGKNEKQKFDERYNQEFVPAYNEYARTVLSRRPFVPESVYHILTEIMNVAGLEGTDYLFMPKPRFGLPNNIDEYYDRARKNMMEMANLIDKACTAIRERIKTMDVDRDG